MLETIGLCLALLVFIILGVYAFWILLNLINDWRKSG